MACFIVPAAEAVVTTVITKIAKEEKSPDSTEVPQKMSFVRKLKWLSNMLWGGAVLLCFEHIWHGEVIPYPPFLTAAYNPADTATMLHEMATVGVAMAVLITAVWVGMVIVSGIIEKRPASVQADTTQEV
ncbi:MAG: hypothetical protein ACOX4R_04160 [Lentihominibacter sp.]